jgi:hypothetical protein
MVGRSLFYVHARCTNIGAAAQWFLIPTPSINVRPQQPALHTRFPKSPGHEQPPSTGGIERRPTRPARSPGCSRQGLGTERMRRPRPCGGGCPRRSETAGRRFARAMGGRPRHAGRHRGCGTTAWGGRIKMDYVAREERLRLVAGKRTFGCICRPTVIQDTCDWQTRGMRGDQSPCAR